MTAPLRAPRPAPRANTKARPQLEVVRAERLAEAARRRLVRRLALAATVAGALCLFGVVVAHVVLTQNQFRLDELRAQSSSEQAEYDRLRLEVAELESPRRIVDEAQQRLGMITPSTVVYLAPSPALPAASGPEGPGGRGSGQGNAPEAGSRALAPLGAPEVGLATTGGWSRVKRHLADD